MLKELAKNTLGNNYFIELFDKAEKYSFSEFFKLEKKEIFIEKEYIDLFRFADILSYWGSSELRNLSFKIVSLLYEIKDFKEIFNFYSISILSRFWNFPTIHLLDLENKIESHLPFERVIEKQVKEDLQSSPLWYTFTDSQFKLYNKLLNNNHFSFSGPTSLWKSFVINSYIYTLAKEKKWNIVFLVPTRALINQISIKLKNDFQKKELNNYKILTHPVVPELFYSSENNYIFVFTPERLISYLWDTLNPKISYIFVDEAHKIISDKDSRSPLYYHALFQAQKRQINLFFASPNLPNPEIFLDIFETNNEEKLRITDVVVNQNRYFIDIIDKKIIYFSDLGKEVVIEDNIVYENDLEIIKKLWEWNKNIIYCNSVKDTINKSLEFSKKLDEINNEKVNKLISLIEKDLHEYYFLVNCLKKWVWFHFGSIPQRIRNKIEELFVDKIIDYIFTTSTLLEWVNLPAKNIFILSDKIWLTKFKSIDFWNLAWRAWRLTKELSWNIICIRNKESLWINNYKEKKVKIDIIKNKEIEPLESQILKWKANFYKHINSSLRWENFQKLNFTENEKRIWDHYWNILLYQEKMKNNSILKENFIKKNKNLGELEKISKKISIPNKFLLLSSDIKAIYQDNILNSKKELKKMSEDVNFDTCKKMLEEIYNLYKLEKEESIWTNPMFPKNVDYSLMIEYYATIMDKWINSASLKRIISSTINYRKEKWIIFIDRNEEKFEINNPYHINEIINSLIKDIDNILRYKLEKYFNNYYLILKERYWEENAWVNWSDFLEYWTTDNSMIELQNLWLDRHLAKYIIERFNDYIEFNELWKLININFEKIKEWMDKESNEYEEFLVFVHNFE